MTTALKRFRVEGLARGGRILHANVIGHNGLWTIYGPKGLRISLRADSLHDALRKAGKKLPFRPVAVRSLESSTGDQDKPDSVS